MSGLFLELRDALIFVGIHYSEAARLLDRHIEYGDRRIRALLLMEADHLRIIHLIYVVAREDKDILGLVSSYKVEVLVYRVRRALVPIRSALSLIRREYHNSARHAVEIPRLSRADVLVQHERLILRKHADRINSRIHTVREGKVYYSVFAAERHRGLCGLFGKCVKAASLPAGKKHRNAFFFLIHYRSSSLYRRRRFFRSRAPYLIFLRIF